MLWWCHQLFELSGPASSSGCLYGQKRQEQVEKVKSDIKILLLCKILFKLVRKVVLFFRVCLHA